MRFFNVLPLIDIKNKIFIAKNNMQVNNNDNLKLNSQFYFK